MLNNKASYRYAQALFSLAQENNKQDAILSDCNLLLDNFNTTKELFNMVKNPTINKDLKKQLFEKVFSNKVGKEIMSLIGLLLQKGRESLLPMILENYNLLYNKDKNIVVAKIVYSKPLADNLINTIKDKLSVMGKVTLIEQQDEKLLGGFVIKIGDLQYDSSVKKQINNVKRAFKL